MTTLAASNTLVIFFIIQATDWANARHLGNFFEACVSNFFNKYLGILIFYFKSEKPLAILGNFFIALGNFLITLGNFLFQPTNPCHVCVVS